MTDKTEGPSKDGGRAADGPGVKRPHATIELKATEVPQPPKAAEPQTGSTTGSGSESGSSAATKPADVKDQKAPGAKPAEPEKAKPESPAATKPAPESAPTTSRGSGLGSFLSHLAAGIVGGAIVYSAAAYLPDPNRQQTTADLDARLASLERAQTTTTTSVEGQIRSAQDELRSLSQALASLSNEQQRVLEDTKAALEKPQSEEGAATLKNEIAELRERLDLIAKGADTSDGRVPQLAAVTGKVADLEASLASQLAELRKTIPADFETRIGAVQETSEAARSGVQRLDRDVAQLRTDVARLAQHDETAEADNRRLQAAIDAAKEQAGNLASTVNELSGMIENRVAKPADVSAAVSPVASKLAALEQSLASVVKSEEDRKANAERIVLSLELANLKRALDRGDAYAAELAEVSKAAQGRIDLAPLERYRDAGVPKIAALETEFRPLLNAVIDAEREPVDGTLVDRFLSGAQSIVRVRKVGHDPSDNSAEAIVGRMETALKAGQLGTVLEEAKRLPARAVSPIQDWLDKVAARHAVDKALAGIESQLKASLAGAEDAPGASEATPPAGTN